MTGTVLAVFVVAVLTGWAARRDAARSQRRAAAEYLQALIALDIAAGPIVAAMREIGLAAEAFVAGMRAVSRDLSAALDRAAPRG